MHTLLHNYVGYTGYVSTSSVHHREQYKPWQSTSVSFQIVFSRHKTVFDVRPSACMKPVWQATTTSVLYAVWQVLNVAFDDTGNLGQ